MERDLGTLPHFADKRIGRYLDLVEEDRARGRTMQSKLLLMRTDHHPFIVSINDERTRLLFAIHFNIGEHTEVICHCRVRDEHLIPW